MLRTPIILYAVIYYYSVELWLIELWIFHVLLLNANACYRAAIIVWHNVMEIGKL